MSGFNIGNYHVGWDNFNPLRNLMDMSEGIVGLYSDAWNQFTGKATAEQAQKNWEQQMKLSKEQLYKGHQIEAADLISAGINPILTASSGGAKTSIPGLPNIENIGGEGGWNFIQQALGKGVDFRGQQSQQGLNSSLGVQALATAGEQDSLAALHDTQSYHETLKAANTATQTELVAEQITQAQALTDKLRKEVDYLNEQINLTKEEIKTAPTTREKISAETKFTQVKQELYKTLKTLGIVGDIAFLGGTGVGLLKKAPTAIKAVKNSKYAKAAVEPVKKGWSAFKDAIGLGSKLEKVDIKKLNKLGSVKNGYFHFNAQSGQPYALKMSTIEKNGIDWLKKYIKKH